MTLILIAIVVAALMAWLLVWKFSNGYSGWAFLATLAGGFLALTAGISAVAYVFVAWAWFASEYQANIINREYGTNYTQEEVFWASSVIDTVRELNRKRIEVNGNVMRGGGGR